MNPPTNPILLLTLRTRCGCVGQGILGSEVTWDASPVSETVQAILSRLDPQTMTVLEIFEIDGDQWREFEDSNAEAALMASIANGFSLEEAFQLAPEPTAIIEQQR